MLSGMVLMWQYIRCLSQVYVVIRTYIDEYKCIVIEKTQNREDREYEITNDDMMMTCFSACAYNYQCVSIKDRGDGSGATHGWTRLSRPKCICHTPDSRRGGQQEIPGSCQLG